MNFGLYHELSSWDHGAGFA